MVELEPDLSDPRAWLIWGLPGRLPEDTRPAWRGCFLRCDWSVPKDQETRAPFPQHLMHCQGCFVLLGPWDARGPRELMLFLDRKNYDQLLFGGLQTISFSFQGKTTIQTSQSCPPRKQHGKRGRRSPRLPPPTRNCQKTLTLPGFCGMLASPPPSPHGN